jgi:hypothetical protein
MISSRPESITYWRSDRSAGPGELAAGPLAAQAGSAKWFLPTIVMHASGRPSAVAVSCVTRSNESCGGGLADPGLRPAAGALLTAAASLASRAVPVADTTGGGPASGSARAGLPRIPIFTASVKTQISHPISGAGRVQATSSESGTQLRQAAVARPGGGEGPVADGQPNRDIRAVM